MKRYRNSDLKALLSKFKDHLTCWKVGLSIGSMLYIEMGRKWSARLKSGSLVEIGSVTLVLESDEWTITRRGNPISDANSVTQDMVDRLASKYFIGQVLDSIQFLADSKQCVISFSDENAASTRMVLVPSRTLLLIRTIN